MHNIEIIQKGDERGNGMIAKFRLANGLEIISLPTPNFYGGEWDLGPTWNYIVLSEKPFLVDAGRYGQGKHLLSMMKTAGIDPDDLDFILISHGHEDHDGGLAELVRRTRLSVKAHKIYDRLIRRYPDAAPEEKKQNFPAKCWHCFMPESFYTEHCLDYHRVLQELSVKVIDDGRNQLAPGIETLHLPGHSPDAIVVKIATAAVIVGDTVLPDISPWPTRRALYQEVEPILGDAYPHAEDIFGLSCYIRSLRQLSGIADRHSEMAVFPAHHFFFKNQWQILDLSVRIRDLIEHHIQRCADILRIVNPVEKSAEEITVAHFDAALLKGFGKIMAINEIQSHCELLTECGDIVQNEKGQYAATGTSRFERFIRSGRRDKKTSAKMKQSPKNTDTF